MDFMNCFELVEGLFGLFEQRFDLEVGLEGQRGVYLFVGSERPLLELVSLLYDLEGEIGGGLEGWYLLEDRFAV